MTTCHSERPKLLFMPRDGEWYDIPGYDGRYKINTLGEVLHQQLHRPPNIVKQHLSHGKGSRKLIVNMYDGKGHRKECIVTSLMMLTFYGKTTGKWRAIHRDGCTTNNDLENLVIMSMREVGQRYGGSANRIPVCRISKEGEIIGIWPSSRKAAKDVFISYQAIYDRCNRKVKNEFALDGTTYRFYDDQKTVDRFCRYLKDAAVRAVGDPVPESEWEW